VWASHKQTRRSIARWAAGLSLAFIVAPMVAICWGAAHVAPSIAYVDAAHAGQNGGPTKLPTNPSDEIRQPHAAVANADQREKQAIANMSDDDLERALTGGRCPSVGHCFPAPHSTPATVWEAEFVKNHPCPDKSDDGNCQDVISYMIPRCAQPYYKTINLNMPANIVWLPENQADEKGNFDGLLCVDIRSKPSDIKSSIIDYWQRVDKLGYDSLMFFAEFTLRKMGAEVPFSMVALPSSATVGMSDNELLLLLMHKCNSVAECHNMADRR
jgi:hypothetical protein